MIGIFDSGYGGMTVLKPLLGKFPNYDYIYFGDNARAPYGNNSSENIRLFAEEAVDFLFSQGAKLIIFACNTASAVALRHVQEKYLRQNQVKDKKILGIIIPMAETVAEISPRTRVGIVGTRATINSGAYKQEILKIAPQIEIVQKACPLLVPLIEEDWHHKPEATMILKKYLRSLKNANLEALILACTHYPLMRKQFQRIMGKKVRILEAGEVLPEKLEHYLARHPEIVETLSAKKQRFFYTSGDPLQFQEFVQKHFGMKIPRPSILTL